MRLHCAILALTLAACASNELTPASTPSPGGDSLSWRFSDERDGLVLKWQPGDGEVPRNQEFEARVLVASAENRAGLADARLVVRGWMPDHQHGLVKDPQVLARGDGLFDVEGLLLHMRGSWQLIFDVFHETKKTSFPFELEL